MVPKFYEIVKFTEEKGKLIRVHYQIKKHYKWFFFKWTKWFSDVVERGHGYAVYSVDVTKTYKSEEECHEAILQHRTRTLPSLKKVQSIMIIPNY